MFEFKTDSYITAMSVVGLFWIMIGSITTLFIFLISLIIKGVFF